MGGVDSAALARHIAAFLDGDYNDGLEAYVEASTPGGNGLHVNLKGDGGDRLGSFRIIIEQIS